MSHIFIVTIWDNETDAHWEWAFRKSPSVDDIVNAAKSFVDEYGSSQDIVPFYPRLFHSVRCPQSEPESLTNLDINLGCAASIGKPFEGLYVRIRRINISPQLCRIEDVEKDLIHEALNATGGNVSHAAEGLGIHRQTLYNKMSEIGRPTKMAKRTKSSIVLDHHPDAVNLPISAPKARDFKGLPWPLSTPQSDDACENVTPDTLCEAEEESP